MFLDMKYCLTKLNCHAPFLNKCLKSTPYKMRKQPKEEDLGNRGSRTGQGRSFQNEGKGKSQGISWSSRPETC